MAGEKRLYLVAVGSGDGFVGLAVAAGVTEKELDGSGVAEMAGAHVGDGGLVAGEAQREEYGEKGLGEGRGNGSVAVGDELLEVARLALGARRERRFEETGEISVEEGSCQDGVEMVEVGHCSDFIGLARIGSEKSEVSEFSERLEKLGSFRDIWHEDSLELLLKIWGEDGLADGGLDFGDSPEAAAVELRWRRLDGAVVGGGEDMDELALPL